MVSITTIRSSHRRKPKPRLQAAKRPRRSQKANRTRTGALIEAISARYADPLPEDPKTLETAYSEAMKAVWKKFPNDADIGALHAESLMNLRPWQLWTVDKKPAPETPAILESLEAVMKLDAKHPLANHLYIHAVEASPYPRESGRGRQQPARCAQPALGHMLHMPSHIDIRRGR